MLSTGEVLSTREVLSTGEVLSTREVLSEVSLGAGCNPIATKPGIVAALSQDKPLPNTAGVTNLPKTRFVNKQTNLYARVC